MADTNFTPGPWNVSTIGRDNDGAVPVVDDEGRIAAVSIRDHDLPRKDRWKAEDAERDANARLIAAAPDLYAALESLLGIAPTDTVECRGDKCREPWCVSCFGEDAAQEGLAKVTAKVNAARAALSKARGE